MGLYESEERRSDNISIEQYIKMRQNDGTVASVYNVMTLPVLSTNFSFTPDEEDANGEQCDFIEDALTAPPHAGGMDTPFKLTLADMLQAIIEGFRVYEKVFRLDDDGKIRYGKIASRTASTGNITLRHDKNGDYDGFRQQVSYQGQALNVAIPAWKSFLFTYQKDKNFLYGESAFKPAYYHYDKKHRLYYLANLAAQVGAVPPKVVTGPSDTTSEVKKKLLRTLDKLGISTTAYVQEQFKVEPYNVGEGRLEILPIIDHHDTQIARSVLAQFLMLGTTSKSAGGSHALSSDQSDLFLITLKGLMATIEDHINFYLIPDLIDLNFSDPHYPKFRFEDITSDVKQIMSNAFTQLIQSGKISDAVAKGIEERMAEALDIDVDAMQAKVDEEAKETAAQEGQEGEPDDESMDPKTQPNQSAKAAGAGPKASATRSGSGRSPQLSDEYSSPRFRIDSII